MSEHSDFRYTLTSLWFRLMSLAIIACVFYEALDLASGKALGWSFYLTGMEVAFEVLVRLIAASLVGLLLGTMATGSIAPILWYLKSWRPRLMDWTTKAVVLAVVFVLSRHALLLLIKETAGSWSDTLAVVKVFLLAFYLAFALALCTPRSRKGLLTGFDGMLSEKMTRRTALMTIAGTAGLVATEYTLSRKLSTVKAAPAPRRPKPLFYSSHSTLYALRTCPFMAVPFQLLRTSMRSPARVPSSQSIFLLLPLRLPA